MKKWITCLLLGAGFALQAGAAVITNVNLLVNSDFQTGNTNGWDFYRPGNPSVTVLGVEPDVGPQGSNDYALVAYDTKGAANASKGRWSAQQTINFGADAPQVQGGQFSASIRGYVVDNITPGKDPNPKGRIGLGFNGGATVWGDYTYYTDSYFMLSYTGAVPTNATSVTIKFDSIKDSSGEVTYYVDDASLVVGEVAPEFTSDPVVKADAEATVAYSGTIADDAVDLNGDSVTFSFSPTNTWLSIASNGELSGTPGTNDVGLNSWTVEVSDGIATNAATLEITVGPYVNRAPKFDSDPFFASTVTEGDAYSDSLVNYASDEESDPMTFTLISPTNSWLTVAPNGDLSGTPGSGDTGLNSFNVQVDGIGGTNTATLNINVLYGGDRTTLFSDGFESGDFATEGWSLIAGPSIATGAWANTGTNYARCSKNTGFIKALDLSGQVDVVLSYSRRVLQLLEGDYLQASWTTNGTDWVELEQVDYTETKYAAREWFIPAEACQAGFEFRFTTVSDKFTRYGFVDDVLVTAGIAPLEDVVVEFSANGSGMSFGWTDNPGKIYDLESCDSLITTNWAVYDDGVTTYENLTTNMLEGVLYDGPVRFFRIIEK